MRTQNEIEELPYMIIDRGEVWVLFPEELPVNQWVVFGVLNW